MSSSSSNSTAVAIPKHSPNSDDHSLVLPSASTASTSSTDVSANNANNKGSSTLAAVSRALAATLAFMFKRPIRLFRPVKISTWAGIQAIAHEQGLSKVNASFIRGLIRKEGWKFFPRHVLPPMVVNTLIGLTLFTTYTTSERFFLSSSSPISSNTPPSALKEFLYVPFISGSLAGAAQSILSAPLDNARLLLLRRQRHLRLKKQDQAGADEKGGKRRKRGARSGMEKKAGGGLPFTSWYQLLRFSVFQSSPSLAASPPSTTTTTATTRKERLEQARRWARRGWSLFGLTLLKDGIGFGVFFAIFEVGREGSRRFGLWFDGINPDFPTPSEGYEEGRTREKERRSVNGLVLQAIGILVSGGLAGWVFSLVSRPFERCRGAVWEGRARWAEKDSRLAMIEAERVESEKKKAEGAEVGEGKKRMRRGKSIGGKSERRSRKLLGSKGRKIGNVRIGQIRRKGSKRQDGLLTLVMKRRQVGAEQDPNKSIRSIARSLRPSALPSIHALVVKNLPRDLTALQPEVRTPLPSAPSLVLSALSRYGPATFLFGSRSSLQALDARLSNSSSTGLLPPVTKEEKPLPKVNSSTAILKRREMNGPTRFIAKRRVMLEIEKLKKGAGAGGGGVWGAVSKVFTFVPPYAIGFLVFALVEGDLKIEV